MDPNMSLRALRSRAMPISMDNIGDSDWKRVNTNIGKPYYFNEKTKVTTWDVPPEIFNLVTDMERMTTIQTSSASFRSNSPSRTAQQQQSTSTPQSSGGSFRSDSPSRTAQQQQSTSTPQSSGGSFRSDSPSRTAQQQQSTSMPQPTNIPLNQPASSNQSPNTYVLANGEKVNIEEFKRKAMEKYLAEQEENARILKERQSQLAQQQSPSSPSPQTSSSSSPSSPQTQQPSSSTPEETKKKKKDKKEKEEKERKPRSNSKKIDRNSVKISMPTLTSHESATPQTPPASSQSGTDWDKFLKQVNTSLQAMGSAPITDTEVQELIKNSSTSGGQVDIRKATIRFTRKTKTEAKKSKKEQVTDQLQEALTLLRAKELEKTRITKEKDSQMDFVIKKLGEQQKLKEKALEKVVEVEQNMAKLKEETDQKISEWKSQMDQNIEITNKAKEEKQAVEELNRDLRIQLSELQAKLKVFENVQLGKDAATAQQAFNEAKASILKELEEVRQAKKELRQVHFQEEQQLKGKYLVEIKNLKKDLEQSQEEVTKRQQEVAKLEEEKTKLEEQLFLKDSIIQQLHQNNSELQQSGPSQGGNLPPPPASNIPPPPPNVSLPPPPASNIPPPPPNVSLPPPPASNIPAPPSPSPPDNVSPPSSQGDLLESIRGSNFQLRKAEKEPKSESPASQPKKSLLDAIKNPQLRKVEQGADSPQSKDEKEETTVANILAFAILARRDNMTIGLDEKDLKEGSDSENSWSD